MYIPDCIWSQQHVHRDQGHSSMGSCKSVYCLLHKIMRAPAVSGEQTYRELCLAACNAEKRLAELRKRKLYKQPPRDTMKPTREKRVEARDSKSGTTTIPTAATRSETRKCFLCHKSGH